MSLAQSFLSRIDHNIFTGFKSGIFDTHSSMFTLIIAIFHLLVWTYAMEQGPVETYMAFSLEVLQSIFLIHFVECHNTVFRSDYRRKFVALLFLLPKYGFIFQHSCRPC